LKIFFLLWQVKLWAVSEKPEVMISEKNLTQAAAI
jgi:hypothetical protein